MLDTTLRGAAWRTAFFILEAALRVVGIETGVAFLCGTKWRFAVIVRGAVIETCLRTGVPAKDTAAMRTAISIRVNFFIRLFLVVKKMNEK